MGAPVSPPLDEEAMKRLTEDLRTESWPPLIYDRLKALNLALEDKVGSVGDNAGRLFLRAGGLPSVIRLLRGTAWSHTPTATSHATTATSDTPTAASDTPTATSDTPTATSDTPTATSDTPAATSDAAANAARWQAGISAQTLL
jgi:hypothetical protein